MGIVHIPSPLQVASGPLNTCAPATDPVAPEFLVSLNTCTPREKVKPSMDLNSPKTIQAILEHIVGRLNGPLDPIWDGPDGHHAEWQPRKGCSQEENDRILAEEEWARWCTELMALTNYNTTLAYGRYTGPLFDGLWQKEEDKKHKKEDTKKGFHDKHFFKSFFDPNPVVPIGMACQQLCTYAYYSRGYSYDDVRLPGNDDELVGVSASNNGHLSHLFEGGWKSGSKYADLKAGFAKSPGPLAAGSIIGFLPDQDGEKKKKQTQGSHVVFVLRAAPSVTKAQFFDTGAVRMGGGMRSKQGQTPMAARGWNGGNYDGQLFQDRIQVIAGGNDIPVCGLGVLKFDKSPAQIRAAVARAKLNRPLGVVRLILLQRAKPRPAKKEPEKPKEQEELEAERVLYVSPYMWMHDHKSAANYHASRLIWSLREIPSYETVQPIWAIFYPVNEMATRLRDAARTVPLKDVWAKNDAPVESVYLTADEDGKARVLLRIKLLQQDNKALEKPMEPPGALGSYKDVIRVMKKTPPGGQHLGARVNGALVAPPYFAPW